MKGKNLKERGITLIALVITIIVLLILAGVTLSILLQTGIIENSQKAVNLYQSKVEDEVKQIDDLNIQMQTQFGILDNTEGEKNQTITGEAPKYNNPIIPVGFKTSNDGASWKSSDGKTVDGWNSGLVIEDKDGNQFVWVPAQKVGGENTDLVEYTKTLGTKNEGITDLDQVQEEDLPDGIDEEKQIGYGGFYIGRYEAGIPETMKELLNPTTEPEHTQAGMKELRSKPGVPVSKKNQVPWNNIDYTQAKANAESMYNDSKYVKSGLLTGRMWDTTLQWLLKTGAVTDEELNEDCSSWGNYRTSTIPGVTLYSIHTGWNIGLHWEGKISTKHSEFVWLLKTGNTEYTKRNNIYDLAGNLQEWTCEENSTPYKRIARGGAFGYYGPDRPTSMRANASDTFSDANLGFRVALYIL